jgi:L-ascorbate metabolism protein UlaG (beta-lactamase superfamily)
MAQRFINNPKLVTVNPTWLGTPLDAAGRFKNHLSPGNNSFKDVWKWQTSYKPQKQEKKLDTWQANVLKEDAFLNSQKDGILWLGHASFFIRVNGVQLIIDPVFGSPSFVMKRQSPLPFSPKLFTKLDYILLSHDHRDHADQKSMRLLAKHNSNATYLTGLKLDTLLHKWTKSNNIQTAGWYQQYNLPANQNIKITYVPSQHWAKRYLTDTNVRLWGGFIIQAAGITIYFGGDSGYGPHFKEIQSIFPNIDIAILGIGAFKPEWFMQQNHTSPAMAVQAFHDVQAKVLIPMHYGTFDLSDEPLGEPYRAINALNDTKQINGKLACLSIGEVYYF